MTSADDAWKAQQEALGPSSRRSATSPTSRSGRWHGFTDVSNAYLSQIERGLHEPSVRVVHAIASALNVSAETLLEQAGVIDDDEPAGSEKTPDPLAGPERTITAILADPSLTSEQREALLTVYRSYSTSA